MAAHFEDEVAAGGEELEYGEKDVLTSLWSSQNPIGMSERAREGWIDELEWERLPVEGGVTEDLGVAIFDRL